jgi:hypothetical protein
MTIYTVAHLNWEGDGITALYYGDECIMEGDWYHNKIDSVIEGFFEGLKHSKKSFEKEEIYVSGDDFPEDECNAPATLTELKNNYPWTYREE